MNLVYFNNDSPRIIGVNKSVNGICLQIETEEGANTACGLVTIKDDIWNAAFQGPKIHKPMYEIVIHDIDICNRCQHREHD